MMNKAEMKQAILEAKDAKNLKWSDIAKAAGLSPEYACSACLGMNHLDKKPAEAVVKVLGLGKDVTAALQRFPLKTWTQAVPTDPLIYRWYEIVGVYGETIASSSSLTASSCPTSPGDARRPTPRPGWPGFPTRSAIGCCSIPRPSPRRPSWPRSCRRPGE